MIHRFADFVDEIVETPNVYTPGRRYFADLEAVVVHYTAGRDARQAARYLSRPETRASAHFVIGPDVTIQAADVETRRTWHAGGASSSWRHLRSGGWVNGATVGIEIANLGWLREDEATRIRPAPPAVADAYIVPHAGDLVIATHARDAYRRRYSGPCVRIDGGLWQAFERSTVDRVVALCAALVREFPRLGLDDAEGDELPRIVGHAEVDPTRKVDPGPAFPLDLLRFGILGGVP